MDHLKLLLNISTDFHPGMESIGDYLIRQSDELKRLGEHMNQTDSTNLEQEILEWRQQEKIDWNTEGTY